MEYTDPKQGITVSAPDGLTCAEINEGLRGLIRENEQLSLRASVVCAGWDAFNSGPGSNLQRMARAYAAMKAAEEV